MKKKRLVCQDCGHEDKIETFSREEAERRGIHLGAARCPKCGSSKVKLYD